MRRAGIVLYPGNPMVSTINSTGAMNSSRQYQPYGVNSQYGQMNQMNQMSGVYPQNGMNQYGVNPYSTAYNPYNPAAFWPKTWFKLKKFTIIIIKKYFK